MAILALVEYQAMLSNLSMQTFKGFLASVKLSTFDHSSHCCYGSVEPHHPFISNMFSLIFNYFSLINFLPYNYSNISPHFYFFISPLLYTLTL